MPASKSAKVKTVVQEVAVALALLPPAAEHAPWLADVALWVAVALTVFTGVQYVAAGSRAATTAGSLGR